MPCKSGTRSNIEAAKAAAQRERELDATDPFRIYWRELVGRVYKSPAGLTKLSDVERQYWAVGCLCGEVSTNVCNGSQADGPGRSATGQERTVERQV